MAEWAFGIVMGIIFVMLTLYVAVNISPTFSAFFSGLMPFGILFFGGMS